MAELWQGRSLINIAHTFNDDLYVSGEGGPQTSGSHAALNDASIDHLVGRVVPTPFNLCFPLLAQDAAFAYTPQGSSAFGDRAITTGDEDESLIFPHHTQEPAASNYFGLTDYTNFLLADIGDPMMPLLATQQLEATVWPPSYADPNPPIPSSTDGDNSLSSPASLGTATDNSSLDRSDASSPWEFGSSWDPPLINAPVDEIICQVNGCAKSSSTSAPCTESNTLAKSRLAIFVSASEQICTDTTRISTSRRRIWCVLSQPALDLSVEWTISSGMLKVYMALKRGQPAVEEKRDTETLGPVKILRTHSSTHQATQIRVCLPSIMSSMTKPPASDLIFSAAPFTFAVEDKVLGSLVKNSILR
ncbi:hypothetical protein Q7P36_001838 [Cladosporium allicinum]